MINPQAVYFDVYNWYWLADDQRLYSSKAQAMVQENDADYQAWLAIPRRPTPWPRDLAGDQTNAELASVLESFGLQVPTVLASTTTHAPNQAETKAN